MRGSIGATSDHDVRLPAFGCIIGKRRAGRRVEAVKEDDDGDQADEPCGALRARCGTDLSRSTGTSWGSAWWARCPARSSSRRRIRRTTTTSALFTIGVAAGDSTAGRATVGLYHIAWEVRTLARPAARSRSASRKLERWSARPITARRRRCTQGPGRTGVRGVLARAARLLSEDDDRGEDADARPRHRSGHRAVRTGDRRRRVIFVGARSAPSPGGRRGAEARRRRRARADAGSRCRRPARARRRRPSGRPGRVGRGRRGRRARACPSGRPATPRSVDPRRRRGMARRDGDRAQRVEDVRAQPQVRVALACASGQRVLDLLDRPVQVAARGTEQSEAPDAVGLPTGIVHLARQREGVLERSAARARSPLRIQTSAESASGHGMNAVQRRCAPPRMPRRALLRRDRARSEGDGSGPGTPSPRLSASGFRASLRARSILRTPPPPGRVSRRRPGRCP